MRRWFIAVWLGSLLIALAPAARAQSPHPLGVGKDARPSKGAIVLCGGKELPVEIFDEFVRLAGGDDARIVHVPSASPAYAAGTVDREAYFSMWKDRKLASLERLHAAERSAAKQAALLEPLTKASGVWIGGGDQSRLIDIFGETAFREELEGILARGGVIGGTSAGAACMSQVMICGGATKAECGAGLGILPHAIVDQHYSQRKREARLLDAIERHPAALGIGIDERTAVIIQGAGLRVIGAGTVTICCPAAKGARIAIHRLDSGEQGEVVAKAAEDEAVRVSFLPRDVKAK